jgi:hypothetical protein
MEWGWKVPDRYGMMDGWMDGWMDELHQDSIKSWIEKKSQFYAMLCYTELYK